jgi:hypothetical protein
LAQRVGRVELALTEARHPVEPRHGAVGALVRWLQRPLQRPEDRFAVRRLGVEHEQRGRAVVAQTIVLGPRSTLVRPVLDFPVK